MSSDIGFRADAFSQKPQRPHRECRSSRNSRSTEGRATAVLSAPQDTGYLWSSSPSTTLAIELANGINIGNKLICVRKLPHLFGLKVLLRLGNVNAIVLGKALEEMHTLMHQPIPGLSLFELERSITESAPLAMKCRATVPTAEVRLQRLFKAAPEDHGGLGLFLTPAIQVTI